MAKNAFEKIMRSTLAMLRQSCGVATASFFVRDEEGQLLLRASDGPISLCGLSKRLNASEKPLAECLQKNRLVSSVIKGSAKKVLLVPVVGEKRTLGILAVGPFNPKEKLHRHESGLRSATTLCAVISANWRLYDWMTGSITQINHDLRTPLTAVQGSIGMVLGGVCGQVDGEVKQMLQMAQKGCERTVKAIENYLTNKSKISNTGGSGSRGKRPF